MVWIVTYDDTNNGDHSTTVWDNRDAAYKDVCANIIDDINQNGWDFSDLATFSAAQDIENHIKAQEWVQAVERWNDWSATYDAGVYWSILGETVFSPQDACTPGSINWPAQNTGDDETLDTMSAPIATTAGATCRGPCGQWNEYACSDKSDGTFVCYQCKMFDGSIK